MSDTLKHVPELRYTDLVAEARGKIAALSPAWTDHGPADLGITLVELLAALVEMTSYRAGRKTDAMTRAFVELLAGAELARRPDLASAVREALAQIWTLWRAVTPEDFEVLAREVFPKSQEALALAEPFAVHRVRCLGERDLEGKDPLAPAPGHVSVVVLPRGSVAASDALRLAMWRFFDPRRLLATRHHVVSPAQVPVAVSAKIFLDDGVSPTQARARVRQALTDWLDPWAGGADEGGWPLGGEVWLSALYELVDGLSGVDFVSDLAATSTAPERTLKGKDGAPVGLRLHPHELPRLDLNASALRLFEAKGDGWEEVS